MDESKEVYEAIEIGLQKLDLKPGQLLAIICPESWTPRQIATYEHYFNVTHQKTFVELKVVFLPHGFELIAINPPEGFGPNG